MEVGPFPISYEPIIELEEVLIFNNLLPSE